MLLAFRTKGKHFGKGTDLNCCRFCTCKIGFLIYLVNHFDCCVCWLLLFCSLLTHCLTDLTCSPWSRQLDSIQSIWQLKLFLQISFQVFFQSLLIALCLCGLIESTVVLVWQCCSAYFQVSSIFFSSGLLFSVTLLAILSCHCMFTILYKHLLIKKLQLCLCLLPSFFVIVQDSDAQNKN